MYKQTNMICMPKHIQLFALFIYCTMTMKTKSLFSRNVYATGDRIWCNKHPRHTTKNKYDKNGYGWYFRFDDDNIKMVGCIISKYQRAPFPFVVIYCGLILIFMKFAHIIQGYFAGIRAIISLPGPCLNIKTVLSTYGDFHVKDKTAVRTSYL